MRDDVLLSRLATQARPPLAGWPLGNRAAGARLVVFDRRRHVIEFPTEPPGRLEITEDGSPTEHHAAGALKVRHPDHLRLTAIGSTRAFAHAPDSAQVVA